MNYLLSFLLFSFYVTGIHNNVAQFDKQDLIFPKLNNQI